MSSNSHSLLLSPSLPSSFPFFFPNSLCNPGWPLTPDHANAPKCWIYRIASPCHALLSLSDSSRDGMLSPEGLCAGRHQQSPPYQSPARGSFVRNGFTVSLYESFPQMLKWLKCELCVLETPEVLKTKHPRNDSHSARTRVSEEIAQLLGTSRGQTSNQSVCGFSEG